mgnify:CR=1 FL=1
MLIGRISAVPGKVALWGGISSGTVSWEWHPPHDHAPQFHYMNASYPSAPALAPALCRAQGALSHDHCRIWHLQMRGSMPSGNIVFQGAEALHAVIALRLLAVVLDFYC